MYVMMIFKRRFFFLEKDVDIVTVRCCIYLVKVLFVFDAHLSLFPRTLILIKLSALLYLHAHNWAVKATHVSNRSVCNHHSPWTCPMSTENFPTKRREHARTPALSYVFMNYLLVITVCLFVFAMIVLPVGKTTEIFLTSTHDLLKATTINNKNHQGHRQTDGQKIVTADGSLLIYIYFFSNFRGCRCRFIFK